jgi:hypothetical protein
MLTYSELYNLYSGALHVIVEAIDGLRRNLPFRLAGIDTIGNTRCALGGKRLLGR